MQGNYWIGWNFNEACGEQYEENRMELRKHKQEGRVTIKQRTIRPCMWYWRDAVYEWSVALAAGVKGFLSNGMIRKGYYGNWASFVHFLKHLFNSCWCFPGWIPPQGSATWQASRLQEQFLFVFLFPYTLQLSVHLSVVLLSLCDFPSHCSVFVSLCLSPFPPLRQYF